MTDTYKLLVLILLLLAGLAFNLLTILAWDPSYIANDGVQYLSTAENWLAGNGFSTNALIYTPHFQGVLPAIQTVWPPGYSVAISILSKLGLDLQTAPLILNLIMHATASLLMWRVLLKMGLERFFATICAFIFYAMAMPWMYVTAGLTEPLFISLLLCSLLLLPDPKKSSLWKWIACGLLIAACISIRYSIVFAAFGTGAGIFTYIVVYERRPITALIGPCFKLSLLIALPTSIFLYLMYRTYTSIGSLDRYSGTKIPETLLTTARIWASKSSELTGFAAPMNSSYGWIANSFFGIFTVLVGSVIVLFFAGAIKRPVPLVQQSSSGSSETSPPGIPPESADVIYFRLFWLVTTVHGLSLIIYLSANSLNPTPLEIISRYLYQVYPGFYAIFCFMLFTVFKQAKSDKKYSLIKTLTSFLVVVYLVAQVNSIKVTREIYFSDAKAIVELMDLPVHDSVNVKTFIARCFATNNVGEPGVGKAIWSPHAQPIHLHTGLPTISQGVNYTDKPFNADEFSDRINDYQIGMFVFINFVNDPSENHQTYMISAKKWLADNGYSAVDMQSNMFAGDRTVEIYSTDPKCDAS